MYFKSIESPVGILTIAAEESCLRSISFGEGRNGAAGLDPSEPGRKVAGEAIRQLKAYFDRRLREFDLPLDPEGTRFQLEVWRELQKIPYGTVISYGELARRLGNPKAVRAVGTANGANPIPIIIPCHRVIGSNGKLIGYGGGLPIKEKLLLLENSRLF